jgi:hypothetical protein
VVLQQPGANGSWTATACVDSGATYSMLSTAYYETMGRERPPLEDTSIALHGASGSDLEVRGQITTLVRVGSKVLAQTLIIGTLSGPDLLLGRDWLFDNGVELNFSKRTMTIHGPATSRTKENHVSLLTAKCRGPVPARTVRRLHATVKNRQLWGRLPRRGNILQ